MNLNQRTCNELGVCQARATCSRTCVQAAAYPFAPGVIEGPAATPQFQGALRWVLKLMAYSAVVGFCLGVLSQCGVVP